MEMMSFPKWHLRKPMICLNFILGLNISRMVIQWKEKEILLINKKSNLMMKLLIFSMNWLVISSEHKTVNTDLKMMITGNL